MCMYTVFFSLSSLLEKVLSTCLLLLGRDENELPYYTRKKHNGEQINGSKINLHFNSYSFSRYIFIFLSQDFV